MKKLSLLTFPAVALSMAMVTSCANDDDVLGVNSGALAETPALTVNLDELSTRGFVSEAGAWTNFKANNNGVGNEYNARVSLMVYDQNNPTDPVAVAVPQVIEWSPTLTDEVTFGSLRIPSGATYDAVAFVEFIRKADNKAFYDTKNLADIRMLLDATVEDNGSLAAEMRDCYTGKVTFTLTGIGDDAEVYAQGVVANPDGTSKPADLEADTKTVTGKVKDTELNLLARRRLAKVRIAMTDFATYGEWKRYLSGMSSTRLFNAEAMKVKDLATHYDAVAQEPRTADRQTTVLLSQYTYGGATPTANWIRPMKADMSGPASLDDADLVGVSYTDAEMAALGDDAVAFPVLSFNYFIPASNDDASVYDMSFAALDKEAAAAYEWSDVVTEEPSSADWKTLNVRHINSVPVKTNSLTTIWGSFVTVGTPVFHITVSDIHGESETILVGADDPTPAYNAEIDLNLYADDVLVVPAGEHYKVYSGGGAATTHRIVVKDGAMLTLAGVNISFPDNAANPYAAITCEGDAFIYLADGTENKVSGGYNDNTGSYDHDYPGIQAGPSGTKLIIDGTGKLEATSHFGAGIGGAYDTDCGDVEIRGGEISVESEDGAGIGSSYYGECGDITITGGKITTTSTSGAGIGAGAGEEGSCGNITITGGTIIAIVAADGAGIGSGYPSSCGNITITGGTITAQSGGDAAGIGAGPQGSCGSITITGGTITASSVFGGAGIGSGADAECGDITITNGVTSVTATKGENAEYSIGAGSNGTCGTVTINDPSKVTQN